jgi:hypothetical protein
VEPSGDVWSDRLVDDVHTGLEGAFGSGVPARSVALYARWWQLETWLRSLAYVELRAQWGDRWTDTLDAGTLQRQGKDQARAYMASPDWKDPLAYLDARKLFDLLDRKLVAV